jgi:uncharacterized protein YndB with AHSA1/START domain
MASPVKDFGNPESTDGSLILRVLALAALVIVVVLIYAAMKPNTFRVQRSIDIHAQPEKIFALIDDFHKWSLWAPQDREDSTMRRTFGGSTSGEGASSEWTSTGSAGKGRMSITESVPASKVLIDVDFRKPFKAHNVNQFTLEPAASGTKVTWTMHGPNLYVMRLMGVFVNMDKMMGKHFEAGLRNLKNVSEQ